MVIDWLNGVLCHIISVISVTDHIFYAFPVFYQYSRLGFWNVLLKDTMHHNREKTISRPSDSILRVLIYDLEKVSFWKRRKEKTKNADKPAFSPLSTMLIQPFQEL